MPRFHQFVDLQGANKVPETGLNNFLNLAPSFRQRSHAYNTVKGYDRKCLNFQSYTSALARRLSIPRDNKRKHRDLFYKVSVRSLFIFASLAETLRSIVRSPISTMSPPRISLLT